MKYSVIIPTLTKNVTHSQIFSKCIDSVLASSKDYELIVIDDGSSYPTQSRGINVKIRHAQNKGIACSWNDGWKIARGEYIAIINDDVTVEPGWLDKLCNALNFDDDYWVAAPGVKGKQKGTGIEEDYQWFPGYCFMMRRDTFEILGGFDETFSPFNYEDTDMWTRVLQLDKKLVRNYNTEITHLEGHVLHSLDYDKVSDRNKRLFIKKWEFDPTAVFYEGAPGPWQK